MKYNKIGFVIADDSEFAPVEDCCVANDGVSFVRHSKKYCRFFCGGTEFVAVLCGTGKVNAAAAAAALIEKEAPDCIVNFGLSGAINGVVKGEIMLGSRFVEYDFDLTPLGYKIGVKPQPVYIYESDERLNGAIAAKYPDIRFGVFATGDRFVTDDNLRQMLIDEFCANCCDMETAAIASVCRDYGMPFASLRYMSDGADGDACESYRAVNELQKDTLLNMILAAFGDNG